MKLHKRILTLVLLIFLLSLGFAGQAQDTTISFLTPPWGVPPNEDVAQRLHGRERHHRRDSVGANGRSIQPCPGLRRRWRSAADVIFITEEGPSNVVATGNMLPLNDLLEMSDLDADDFEKLDFWTSTAIVYAIPTYLQLVMMDYNTAKLAEAGYDAPPTTWAELDEQARPSAKAAGVDEYPIAMGAINWSWWLIALSMGDPMFDEDLNPVFADEGSKAREAMACSRPGSMTS